VHLRTLAASAFRNLASFRFEPSPRFNIFEGRNGQGKTNLLEAIYLLSAFKSHRDAKSGEMVAFGAQQASVLGEIVRREVGRSVEVQLHAKGKRVLLDGKAITALPASFAHLNAVIFGPDDLDLTKGGPAPRRAFLDRAVYASNPDYLFDLKAYRQALDARNRMIRESRDRHRGGGLDLAMFEAFSETLMTHGLRMMAARVRFLSGFRERFQSLFGRITDRELHADISAIATIHVDAEALVADPESQRGAFRAALERARDGDMRLGYTRLGPHADDLLCTIDQRPVRTYASQGQHRAFVLALKLAELEVTRDALGIYPIFLLDDVSSELDERRNHFLMATLDASGGQVFITTTDRRWIRVADAAVHTVDGGVLHPLGGVSAEV
jgi:DNA replication and repair protein RecF